MRIRRRPQAQALIPSPLHHQPSDPSTPPPPPPPNQHHRLPRKEAEDKLGELHGRPNVDLGVGDEPSRPPPRRVPLPSHPQGNNVVVGRSSENPSSGGGGGGAQRQGAAKADGHAHGRQENGHRDKSEWLVISAGEERRVNGVVQEMQAASQPAVMHANEVIKSDGTKRRRGPAVLLEGSRCSRVNGRGWRCSQPTLVGYALCEHHLGTGRRSRSANGGRSACAPKLGRTEPASGKKSTAAQAVVTIAAAKALRDIRDRSIEPYSESFF